MNPDALKTSVHCKAGRWHNRLERRSRPRTTILNCAIDALTMQQTLDFVDAAIRDGRSIQHGVVDAGKLALMHADEFLYRSVTESDIVNGEGQLLVWLSKLQRESLPERVVGLELFENLLGLAHARGYQVYLFGAREAVVREVVARVSARYSPQLIAGFRNGYYAPEEEEAIARQIAASGAQMLFVGISSPKKELFLYRHRDILATVNFRMGVGGSFDVVAGKVSRAPRWMQQVCLEWFYRFLQEPRQKWKVEVVDSFHFLGLLLAERLRRAWR
jgi:N-acetylglucosaminyldiphosphoundecaprenol N-acetyl-beta-D-mannosaminyltransferase